MTVDEIVIHSLTVRKLDKMVSLQVILFVSISTYVSTIVGVKLLPCQDLRPTFMCQPKSSQTKEAFRNSCLKNWKFARFQCCASCAVVLGVGELLSNGTVHFTNMDGAKKLLLPRTPCQDEGTLPGTSWTIWCKNMIKRMNASVDSICSINRAIQQHCMKTCDFEECHGDSPYEAPRRTIDDQPEISYDEFLMQDEEII